MMKFKRSLLLFSIIGYAILFSACQDARKLPILGPRDTKTVTNSEGKSTVDTIYQTIPDFKLLNQDSIYISNEQFKDKIYIADFFFTSCSTICPTMHRNMKIIFEKYKDNPDVKYLSHTIDFKYDKPSVLKKYAQKLGVDGNQWQFVYGAKDSIYKLAEYSYLVAVMEDTTSREGYVHQGWLVLIDRKGRIRGAYDGTNPEQVAQLMSDIPVLLNEDKK